MDTKTCGRCHVEKPISEFYVHRLWGYQSYCKTCKIKYNKENSEHVAEIKRQSAYRTGHRRPMSDAKDTASYLGIVIAEEALSNFFDHIERMPIGNPGYDFICGRGFKIDVKSSVLHPPNFAKQEKSAHWNFGIRGNDVADYFLCIGFDNRESLTPMHVWLFHKNAIGKRGLHISDNAHSLKERALYERPLDRVLLKCEAMRG